MQLRIGLMICGLAMVYACGKDLKLGKAPDDCAKDECDDASGRISADAVQQVLDTLELRLSPGIKSIQLEWDAISAAESYNLYWNNTGSVTVGENQISLGSASYTHTDLDPAMTYYYILTAVLPGGIETRPSAEFSAVPLPNSLYVNQKYGDDGADGSPDHPKKTIAASMQAAVGATEIHVAEGTYSEILTMKDGVRLVGGYSQEDWQVRDTSAHATILMDTRTAGASNVNSPIRTVEFVGAMTMVTSMDGFVIHAANVEADKYAAAVFLKDSSNVFLKGNVIYGPNSSFIGTAISAVNAQAEISENVVDGGDGAYSVGIYILGKSNLTITQNTISGGTGSDNAIGLNDFGTGEMKVNGNAFYGGVSQVSYGARFASVVGSKQLFNNTIDAGDSGLSIGVEISGTTVSPAPSVFIRNNTISGGGTKVNNGLLESYGILLGHNVNQIAEVANNIVFAPGSAPTKHCIYERFSDSTPQSVRNNNLFGCSTSLYRNEQGAECATTFCQSIFVMESLTDMVVRGNVSISVQFKSDFTFNEVPPSNVSQGGLDGAALGWTNLSDKAGKPRTNGTPNNPDNFDAGGWTMGAFERD